MLLGHSCKLVGDHCSKDSVVIEDGGELVDLPLEGVRLLLELESRELREASQRHVEDVVGLRVAEVEDGHEPIARRSSVIRFANDLDNLIDVEDCDEQAFDEVQSILRLLTAVGAAAPDNVEPMAEEDVEHLQQAEGLRLAVDEGDRVDVHLVLEWRQLEQRLEDGLGVEAILDLDHEIEPGITVGEVDDIGDALELLAQDEVLDALGHLLRSDAHR
ncbi:unannotated protein [freshwater metagenome]|uniref:Unannotated protein n=1 Tax=freshwater metagenome TaxID=449393 RepID=A0A6J7QNP3_9ZZZZ